MQLARPESGDWPKCGLATAWWGGGAGEPVLLAARVAAMKDADFGSGVSLPALCRRCGLGEDGEEPRYWVSFWATRPCSRSAVECPVSCVLPPVVCLLMLCRAALLGLLDAPIGDLALDAEVECSRDAWVAASRAPLSIAVRFGVLGRCFGGLGLSASFFWLWKASVAPLRAAPELAFWAAAETSLLELVRLGVAGACMRMVFLHHTHSPMECVAAKGSEEHVR